MTASIRRIGLLPSRSRKDARGQALIEFAMIVPVFMLLLIGLLEFGMVFSHHLTLEYGTREGARTGAALGNGGGVAATCANIDPQIVAAVERVLASPGSPVDLTQVTQITIWRSDASGLPIAGSVNLWTYTGPNSGPTVDGSRLHFSQSSQPWAPCSRLRGPSGDSIGVGLSYRYRPVTPLANVMRFFGGSGWDNLRMDDGTVMALHP